ncbi:MAG: 50S ribosomal protein L24 [Candidatus ainarchaeum sp.]|nr:50S ribosomal protein L24 [Candidatus ainarchaeum sp.]
MISSKPGKNRKNAFTAPMHKKSKTIAGHLGERLRKEIGIRSIPLRKNDVVKIIRGTFKGKEGKIIRIDRKNKKIFIEKIVRKKSDGTEFEIAIDPSKIIVRDLDKTDKKRLKNKKNKSVKK